MHYASTIREHSAHTPKSYEKFSRGFRHASFVEHGMGSVHMGTAICFLAPQGSIGAHLHAFEESFYILEGEPIVQIEDQAYQLRPGNFGLIGTGKKHSWHNGSGPAR